MEKKNLTEKGNLIKKININIQKIDSPLSRLYFFFHNNNKLLGGNLRLTISSIQWANQSVLANPMGTLVVNLLQNAPGGKVLTIKVNDLKQ